jgi:hypothetical protein
VASGVAVTKLSARTLDAVGVGRGADVTAALNAVRVGRIRDSCQAGGGENYRGTDG